MYARRHGKKSEHEVERRQHPRDRGHAHVELPEELGESERHDRGVSEHEPDRKTEQRGTHVPSLGAETPLSEARARGG
jgi:hypothetical protein